MKEIELLDLAHGTYSLRVMIEKDYFLSCSEDKKYHICFDEVSEKILMSIPKSNRAFVQNQLNLLDRNFIDYLEYWNEKYYRNGFCDGVQLIGGCVEA